MRRLPLARSVFLAAGFADRMCLVAWTLSGTSPSELQYKDGILHLTRRARQVRLDNNPSALLFMVCCNPLTIHFWSGICPSWDLTVLEEDSRIENCGDDLLVLAHILRAGDCSGLSIRKSFQRLRLRHPYSVGISQCDEAAYFSSRYSIYESKFG